MLHILYHNFFIFFSYTIPTFLSGFKRDLDESDLTETLEEHKSSYLGNNLEKNWKEEEERALKKKRKPSLQRVLIKSFGLEFLIYGIVLAFSEAIRFVCFFQILSYLY